MRITKSFVDKIALSQVTADGKTAQSFYRDSDISGFGLRVTSGGAKLFIIEKRIFGKVKRITLGRYGNVTVEQARREAMKFLGEVATGTDPVAEKKVKNVKLITLEEAFDDYLNTVLLKSNRTLSLDILSTTVRGLFVMRYHLNV